MFKRFIQSILVPYFVKSGQNVYKIQLKAIYNVIGEIDQ